MSRCDISRIPPQLPALHRAVELEKTAHDGVPAIASLDVRPCAPPHGVEVALIKRENRRCERAGIARWREHAGFQRHKLRCGTCCSSDDTAAACHCFEQHESERFLV